jgi:hypothetical protein
MVELSQFACIPEVSYDFRRHAASVSSRHREHQQALGWLSQDCRKARAEGRSEEPYLAQAQAITDRVRQERSKGNAGHIDLELNYLIGSRLAQEGRREAARYLWPVALRRPWHWKAWVRLVQSYTGGLFGGSVSRE